MSRALFDKDRGGETVDKVLTLAERYRIVTPHVIGKLNFKERDKAAVVIREARDLLNDLTESKRLSRIKGKSAFARDAYVYPGHSLKAGADLARLWYCFMEEERRYFVTHDEVKELFFTEDLKPPYHNYFSMLAKEEGGTVLYRFYLCRAERSSAREQIVDIIGRFRKACPEWVEQGSCGIAIAVQSASKAKEIENVITRRSGGSTPLTERARITVSVVPTEQSYGDAIKKFGGALQQ